MKAGCRLWSQRPETLMRKVEVSRIHFTPDCPWLSLSLQLRRGQILLWDSSYLATPSPEPLPSHWVPLFSAPGFCTEAPGQAHVRAGGGACGTEASHAGLGG